MMIRATVVGIVLALQVPLAFAADTGSLRLTIRDVDGPLPGVRVDLQCPKDTSRRGSLLTGIDGSVVVHEVPASKSPDESGCTLTVDMVTFCALQVSGITVRPGRQRVIPIFMVRESRTRVRISLDTVIACSSLDDLLTALFGASVSNGCERVGFDPLALPVLERRKPIYDGRVITVRRIRAPSGSPLWVMDFWENARPSRESLFYRAYYARTRVPVQIGPERDTENLSFFERGETILVRSDPATPAKTGRVPVVTKHGSWGWVDFDKLTDGRTETLPECP